MAEHKGYVNERANQSNAEAQWKPLLCSVMATVISGLNNIELISELLRTEMLHLWKSKCYCLWNLSHWYELGSLWTVLDSQDFIVVRNKFKKKILIGYLDMSSI